MAGINPLLALIAGAGQGVTAVDQMHRLDDEQRARAAEQQAQRALQQLTMRKDLEDLGLRPQTDSDVGNAAARSLSSLPGPSITPSAISVPGPQVAKIDGQSPLRNYAESAGSDASAATPDAGRAMKQLVVQQTFAKKPATDDSQGTTLTDALHPETITDVYGKPQQYVHDESITPEARAMRELTARGKIDRDNTMAVRDAEIAAQQNQASIDRERRRQSYLSAGYSPQDAAVAAENPAMADNIFAAKHPRAESPSEVEYRHGLTDERQNRERELTAKYIATAADKFTEAANGDPNLAAALALQSKDGQLALTAGMAQADFKAAAQRYKDRFTAKSKSTGDMEAFMRELTGGGSDTLSTPTPRTPSGPTTASVPAATGNGQKQHITQDQADYIKSTRGWTDAQIAARYVVR